MTHCLPVLPGALGSCIRNVVFDHITFHEPFKAIYIKSNPGDVGVGTVSNITYSNVHCVSCLLRHSFCLRHSFVFVSSCTKSCRTARLEPCGTRFGLGHSKSEFVVIVRFLWFFLHIVQSGFLCSHLCVFYVLILLSHLCFCRQQPGQPSKGCSFTFPVRGECQTQPRVTISNIVIRDSVFEAGVTLPGVLYCDPANPCKGITLSNVSNTGVFAVQPTYFCKNAVVRSIGSTLPVPQCVQTE